MCVYPECLVWLVPSCSVAQGWLAVPWSHVHAERGRIGGSGEQWRCWRSTTVEHDSIGHCCAGGGSVSFLGPRCCRLLSLASLEAACTRGVIRGGKDAWDGFWGGGGEALPRKAAPGWHRCIVPFLTAVLSPRLLSSPLGRVLGRVQVMIDRGRIDEPSSCHLCGNTLSMELVHNRCLFTDKQMIRLQVRSVGLSSSLYKCTTWLREDREERVGIWVNGKDSGQGCLFPALALGILC